jgi:hypothetical protein
MMRWTFWEWVAYAILFVAAVLLAIDQGIKLSPELFPKVHDLISTPYWAFAPLALLLLATTILIGRELGWLGLRERVTTISADTASLRLHIYADERMPQRLGYENVWRWYFLKQLVTAVDPNTRQEYTATVTCVLFLTFDIPVKIGTLEVSSIDIKLPRHEVKDFNPRSAVIVFLAELPAGTLDIRVNQ